MVYRKLKANAIFTGKEMLDQHSVLVTAEDGHIVDIIPESNAGEGIESWNGILCPGFVNCHCHLELSHLRGLVPEKTGLVDFVLAVVTGRHFPEEEILRAIVIAEDEMLQNGIVAVGDICNNGLTISQKKKQRLVYHNFIELSGWNPDIAEIRFQKSKSTYDEFCGLPDGAKHASMNPHAPYSVSEALWEILVPYLKDKLVTMHNQETEWENEFFVSGIGDAIRMYQRLKTENPTFRTTGKSSLQSSLRWFRHAKQLILVHNTFIQAGDLDYVEKTHMKEQVNFCLCPNANLYIEGRLPPIDMLRRANAQIVLGTDSLASNHGLSILEEMRTILNANPQIPTAEILQWATFNGARALGLHDSHGLFKQGRKPGVILLEYTHDRKITSETSVIRLI